MLEVNKLLRDRLVRYLWLQIFLICFKGNKIINLYMMHLDNSNTETSKAIRVKEKTR